MKLEIHHYHHYPELTDMSEQLDAIRRRRPSRRPRNRFTALPLGLLAAPATPLGPGGFFYARHPHRTKPRS